MIVQELSNTNPISTKGLATVLYSTVITRADDPADEPEPFEAFNINDYECPYEELAFGELDPNKDRNWKSDKSSFLFNISLPTDTVDIKLIKCTDCGEEEVAILDDNILGTYFPVSYFQALEIPQLKIGFLLEWKKVLATHGAGKYFIRADRTIIDRDSVTETHAFRLYPWNEKIARNTVRIQSFHSGIIEGGNNYLGFEWEQMVRIKGSFGRIEPTQEIDSYENTKREIEQIQEKMVTDYALETRGLPSEIAKPLLYDKFLANKILITDYDLFNFDKYRDYPIYPKGDIEAQFPGGSRGFFQFKFTDKKQNIIKRNFI